MSKEFGVPFGSTSRGEEVRELTLSNGVLTARVITFGGVLRVLTVPGRDGPVDVVLGYDTVAEYEANGGYFGALVGRFANRIAKGRFTLDGREYTLACNDGPNHLHGGTVGWSHRVWGVEEADDEKAVLTLDSPDGEEGYPGHVQVKVTYALEGDALSIHYEAVTDRNTPCNLTNHSYFNLSGQGSGDVLEQEIRLLCSSYTPTDSTSIPLGTIDSVEGTPMDLRQPTPIGRHIDEPFQQLVWGHGYDHNFVIDGRPGTMRPAAQARSKVTGIVMEVETDSPGVQFYTANYVEEARKGKAGAVYGFRHGFCLETQHFPDTPNQPGFPSCTLRADAGYSHTTRFRFSVEKQ